MVKRLDELTKADVVSAQSDLLECFDNDIDVEIRKDLMLHITSKRAPDLDFVVQLLTYTEGLLKSTSFLIGTSKSPPKLKLDNVNGTSGEQLKERILQWRETQELAKKKQLEAQARR